MSTLSQLIRNGSTFMPWFRRQTSEFTASHDFSFFSLLHTFSLSLLLTHAKYTWRETVLLAEFIFCCDASVSFSIKKRSNPSQHSHHVRPRETKSNTWKDMTPPYTFTSVRHLRITPTGFLSMHSDCTRTERSTSGRRTSANCGFSPRT